MQSLGGDDFPTPLEVASLIMCIPAHGSAHKCTTGNDVGRRRTAVFWLRSYGRLRKRHIRLKHDNALSVEQAMQQDTPMRTAIAGLSHDHVIWLLRNWRRAEPACY